MLRASIQHFPLVVVLVSFLLVSSAEAQENAVIKTGRFWSVVADHGGLGTTSLGAGWFPNDFNTVGNSTGAGSSVTGGNIYLTTTNWNGIGKVVCAPLSAENPQGTVVSPLESYARYGLPESLLNRENVTQPQLGQIAPDQIIGTADQMIENTFEYAIGVQAHRRVWAWSRDAHDDYLITEVTFTNTSDQVLTDFLISMQIGRNDYTRANGSNPSPSGLSGTTWKWHHYYGGRPGDSLRVWYWYHADDPTTSGDNMGLPVLEQEGRLVQPDIQFYGFLHASEEPFTDPSEDINDPLQPHVTFTAEGQVVSMPSENARQGAPLNNPAWFDRAQGELARQIPMEGAYENTLHMANSDEVGDPDFQTIGPMITYNGWHAYDYSGIGPYEAFEPGESIRIVYAVGSQGLGLAAAKEIGQKMVDETLQPPPDLPDQTTGYFPPEFKFPEGADEYDINKDLWLSTGIDSVHRAIYNAKWNYEHDFEIPASPPPPSQSVDGFPDYVSVKWSNPEVEQLDNFAGYRVLRRRSALDTVFFDVVYETGPEETGPEHEFQDSDVRFGGSYYYYVQAGVKISEDNLNALPEERGKTIWSGRAYQATPQEVQPPREASEDLADVRVAPNPYNINDPRVQSMGWTDFRGIIFFNLPAQCTIEIFSESGDLLQTIEHDSPVNAGSVTWDMLTSSQQVISSGVYVAVITDSKGETAIRKFLVAR
jgi:hypothetical protein